MSRSSARCFSVISFLVLGTTFSLLCVHMPSRPLVDEASHHLPIVNQIRSGQAIGPKLPAMFLGYHFTLGYASRWTGIESLQGLRAITTFMSWLSILVFFAACRKLNGEAAWLRSMQFLLMPLVFPFSFLVYTDVFSLGVLLAALFFFLTHRLWLAGACGGLSLLVRQTNLYWLGVMLVWQSISTRQSTVREKVWSLPSQVGLATMLFVLPVAFEAQRGFLPLRRGHVAFTFGNIWLFLSAVAVLFFPAVSVRRLWSDRWAILSASVPLLVMWQRSLKHLHPYNTSADCYYVRSCLIGVIQRDESWYLLMYALSVLGFGILLSLLPRPKRWALVGILLFPLAWPWLIEVRYMIPSFAALQLVRREFTPAIEWTLLGLFIVVSTLVTWLIFSGTAFL